MKVLVDASGITKKKAGVGIYAKNLLDHLTTIAHLRIVILAQDDDPQMDYGHLSHVRMIWLPAKVFRKQPIRILFEQMVLPFLAWKHQVDLIHSLHYSFPLRSFQAKRIVTIHDMTSFSMPEVHLKHKKHYYRFFIRRSARQANGLIFVSNSAYADFKARFGEPAGVHCVIHHGKDEIFKPCSQEEPLQSVRHTYSLPERFILYMGTIEPRKNLIRLVDAFFKIKDQHPDLHLVLAGKRGWMYADLFKHIKALGLQEKVLFPGYIEESDKHLLLCAAEVFAYISLYEGFGLPVLEALACGTPTITSNTSSLPEVAGEAALMVDPTNVDEASLALDQLLSNSELRQRLRFAGLMQASIFTWSATAEKTVQAYRATISKY